MKKEIPFGGSAFLLLGLLLIGLVGCSGEKLPTLVEAYSAEMGIVVSYPEEWASSLDPFNMQMATDAQYLEAGDPINITDGSMMIVTGVDMARIGALGNSLTAASSPIEFVRFFEELVIDGAPGSTVREAPKMTEYNGYAAATMVLDMKNKDGEPIYAVLTAVPNENIVIFIFLGTDADQETDLQPLFDAILDSITLKGPGLQQW